MGTSAKRSQSVFLFMIAATLGITSTGCTTTSNPPSDSESDVQVVETPDITPRVFQGTLAEYTEARISCLEQNGIAVTRGDPNDSPYNFSYSADGIGQARLNEVIALCHDEIGEYVYPPDTEESVTARYEWLLGQYNCLVDAGFDMPPYMTLDAFLDEWRRVGFVADSDPIGQAVERGANYTEALAACPRTTETWD